MPNLGLYRSSFNSPFDVWGFADFKYNGVGLLDILQYDESEDSSYYEDDDIRIYIPYSPIETPATCPIGIILKEVLYASKNEFNFYISTKVINDNMSFTCFKFENTYNKEEYLGYILTPFHYEEIFNIAKMEREKAIIWFNKIHPLIFEKYKNEIDENRIDIMLGQFDTYRDIVVRSINRENIYIIFYELIKEYINNINWFKRSFGVVG
ncbi:hypothetical protein V6R21_04985 [Limibacter armeniacum]|uniref:hypothetical protein n=1 Tax=Limibacter armeniacum TaxID=466084 RepID=UPI002FE685ED